MSDGRPPEAVLLMGPTASGKTELAVELVERGPFAIISVDSAMVYRGMDIGTAKPGPEVLARAPHRLIDLLDPAEAYSAARFRADALREMEAVRAAGRVPLLVGGTMLYFRALREGLSRLPAADAEGRARLEAEAAADGWDALHARLAAVDPQSAARIHPNDPQRLQRALEVFELTGRPLSELWAERSGGGPPPWRWRTLVVAPADRSALRDGIARRFHGMLEAGLLQEVEALYRRGDLHPGLPSIRSVGYRQAWAHLAGELDRETLIERAVTATRQLAKRQFTWLRRETEAAWFAAEDPDRAEKVLNFLAETSMKGG